MKNLTLIIGCIVLLLNLVIGLNSGVIIVNTLLLYILGVSQIKDGFKISLSFLFLIAAVIEFILAFFVPDTWINNVALTMLILLFAGQIILYIIAYFVSKIS